MRLALILLLLAPAAHAAQTWPAPEGSTFTPDSPAQMIQLCRPVLGCTPAKAFAGPANCGYFSWPGTFPQDNTYPGQCKPVVTAPPVTLPAGVSQIALAGELFPHPQGFDARMCKRDFTACSRAYRFPAQGGQHYCNTVVFPDAVGGEACFSVPAPVVAASLCWTLNPLAYRFDDVPAATSTYYTDAVSFKCEDGKVDVMLYTKAERNAAFDVMQKAIMSGDSVTVARTKVNAYIAAQPMREPTVAEEAFKTMIRASYGPTTPPTPPPPVYVVQPVSATVVGDRPVYRLKADGTRNTTAVSGIRAPGNTPCGKRLGTTSYYEVPSVGAGLYAVCVLKP